MFYRILLVCSVFFIAACSSSSSEHLARNGKWFEVGLQDGQKGLTSRSLLALQELAKGTAIDFSAYDEGYKKGIEQFCNPHNAYSIGLSGIQYYGTCSGFPDGERFNMEWQRGYQAHQSAN